MNEKVLGMKQTKDFIINKIEVIFQIESRSPSARVSTHY